MRRLIKRIKHIIQYLPLLWRDQHWDYAYLLYLISFKLEKMEHTLRDNDIIADLEETVKGMRVCNKLLKRFLKGDYHIYFKDNGESGIKQYIKEDEKQQRDLDLCFKIMAKYCRSWWD